MSTVAKKTRPRIPPGAKPEDWEGPDLHPASFYIGPKDECFERTVRLSLSQVRDWFHLPMIDPKEIFPVLKAGRIDFVVLGLYGISGWLKKPRATDDCDILVPKRQVKPAVKLLCKAFPQLTARDTEVVVRLAVGDEVVIDVMKPHHPVFVETLANTRLAEVQGHRVKVPTLEMALVLKFFAMTSPYREQEKKYQDAHDFLAMFKHNAVLSMQEVQRVGELVYPGAGAEIVKMLEDVRAGRRLEI